MSTRLLVQPCRLGSRHATLLLSQKRVMSPAFFRKFVCRVSTPAQKEKGAGFKTQGGRRLPLVAACAWRRVFWAAPSYVMPSARYAIRTRCNSFLGFLCERCEIGQRSFICLFHGLLSRVPRYGKTTHRRQFPQLFDSIIEFFGLWLGQHGFANITFSL